MRTPKKRPARRAKRPSGTALRGFADARKTKSDLLREIQTHVVAEGVKNSGVGRESHKIHVSELIKDETCPRQLYYKLTHAVPSDPPAPAYHRLEMIWATGHDAHHKWQRWLKEMGDLWGTWFCLSCEHKWIALAPTHCEKCSSELLRYDEVDLESMTHYLVGHADGAVPRLNTLIEVKSFAVGTIRIEHPDLVKEHTHKVDGKTITDIEGIWAGIKRPFKSHLKQGMFYLWMCQNSGDPELERYKAITFIYENKTTQATKTFEVTFSDRLIRPYIEVLEGVVDLAATGVAPDRPKLFSKDSKPCNVCVFRGGCWSDDGETSPTVPAGGQGHGGEEASGEAALPSPRTSRFSPSGGSRRRHGTPRPGPDRADDAVDTVGRAPRRATGDGGGRRAVGGSRAGQGTGSRFSRQRQGRDGAEGEGVREPRVRSR